MMIYAYVYIYLYVCSKAHAKRGVDNSTFSEPIRRIYYLNRMLLLSMIIVMFYVYSSVCRAIFQLMECRQLEPEGYFLFGDLDTKCYIPSYYAWSFGIGIPGFIVYVFGIPILFGWILYV